MVKWFACKPSVYSNGLGPIHRSRHLAHQKCKILAGIHYCTSIYVQMFQYNLNIMTANIFKQINMAMVPLFQCQFNPYMCAIPACEEFITEFCEFPFLSPNSVHASSPFSVNHIFFHWIQWHFWPWFFCSYNFALNSVNFLAPTWSLKKNILFVTTI